jgi:hypothetical protein
MDPIEGSETSAFKHRMPGKYPKENILQAFRYLENLDFLGVKTYARLMSWVRL